MNRAIAAAVLLLSTCSVAAFAATNRSDSTFVRPNPGLEAPMGGGSCASPVTIASLPFSQAGNTCGGTNNITTYGGPCATALPFPYPGPEDVWAITVNSGNALDISASLTGSTGDLALFFLTSCGDGSSCIGNSQDAVGPGQGPEQLDPVDTSNLAPGTYYVYVDSYYSSGSASCGTYTLNVTGTLPVSLESFQID